MFTPFTMFRRAIAAGIIAASALGIGSAAQAKTIRIAEHRQARIDALKKVVPEIEKKYNVKIEVIEYPAPEKDYLTKLLTELRAGNAPDLFTAPHGQDVADMVAAEYLAPITPNSRLGTAMPICLMSPRPWRPGKTVRCIFCRRC